MHIGVLITSDDNRARSLPCHIRATRCGPRQYVTVTHGQFAALSGSFIGPGQAAPTLPIFQAGPHAIGTIDWHLLRRRAHVACHVHGTAVRGFLPRAWDHLVASDGTTRRVVPGVLITCVSDAFKSIGLEAGIGIPGGCGD
jgi:hypothetical protein